MSGDGRSGRSDGASPVDKRDDPVGDEEPADARDGDEEATERDRGAGRGDDGPERRDEDHVPSVDDLGEKDLSSATAAESRVKQWFLLRGNRLTVTGVIIGGVFSALLVANQLWTFEMLDLVTETGTVGTLLNTLLSGTILLVSVVVSINSIVLSQDLTSVGTQQERLENAVSFRESVEDLARMDASPTDPSEFVGTTLEIILERTDELEAAFEADRDDELSERIDGLVDAIELNTELVRHRVIGADPNSVDVLIAGLDYSYSNEIQAIQQFDAMYGDAMSAEQRECVEGLVEALKRYAVAHEYFKSLFYMREFAKLSKALLYVALPVIVVTAYVMLAIAAAQIPQFNVGNVSSLTVFTMAAFSIALSPYILFTAFVLRSATVAARSLAVGPFTMDQR